MLLCKFLQICSDEKLNSSYLGWHEDQKMFRKKFGLNYSFYYNISSPDSALCKACWEQNISQLKTTTTKKYSCSPNGLSKLQSYICRFTEHNEIKLCCFSSLSKLNKQQKVIFQCFLLSEPVDHQICSN